jgi:hypothetical protein
MNRPSCIGVRILFASGCLTAAGCQQPQTAPPGERLLVDLGDAFALDAPGEAWRFSTPSRWQILAEGERRFLHVSDPPGQAARPGNATLSPEQAVHGTYQFHNFSFSSWLRLDPTAAGTGRDAFVLFGRQDDARAYWLWLTKRGKESTAAVLRIDNGRLFPLASSPLSGQRAIADRTWYQIDILRNADTGTIEVYLDRARPALIKVIDKTYSWGAIGVGSVSGGAGFGQVLISGEARRAG